MNLTIENLEKLKGFGKKKKFINKHKLLPQFPFNLCISGPTGCGKGVLLLNLILKFIHFDRLYLATKHIDQPQVQMLVKFFEKIEEKCDEQILFVTNDLNEVQEVDEYDGRLQNLVVFDDMQCEKDLNKISSHIIRGRHNGIATICIFQQYTKIPRVIRLNTHYFCIFNSYNKTEERILYNEIGFALPKEKFMEYYRKALAEKYNFFFVDTRSKEKELIYRKNFNEIIVEKNNIPL